ncbi:MAG: hypothetical protein ACYC91_16885 [Solirubrobacteraceae bacterium]
MKRKYLPAALAAGALTVAAAGCGSSGNNAGSQAMPGMDMPTAAGHTMSGGTTMSGRTMQGMTPLVAGADGTRASAAGLTLGSASTQFVAGRATPWTFRITDAQGKAITRFEVDQTKLLHLIVVRSDLTGYQHLHPTLGSGGLWSVPLNLVNPGSYRAIADFTTARKRYALGVDLSVPGSASLASLPSPSSASAVDGYSVSLTHGAFRAGAEAQLKFTITRDGKPVTALETYLGAYGHLVALRKPNLAYAHVHPTGESLKMGSIVFAAELPKAATYRLFLQFQAAGTVHTAPFTIVVGS